MESSLYNNKKLSNSWNAFLSIKVTTGVFFLYVCFAFPPFSLRTNELRKVINYLAADDMVSSLHDDNSPKSVEHEI